MDEENEESCCWNCGISGTKSEVESHECNISDEETEAEGEWQLNPISIK